AGGGLQAPARRQPAAACRCAAEQIRSASSEDGYKKRLTGRAMQRHGLPLIHRKGYLYAGTSGYLDDAGADLLYLGGFQRPPPGAAPKTSDNFRDRARLRLSRHAPDEPVCRCLREGARVAQHLRHCFALRHDIPFPAGLGRVPYEPGRSGQSGVPSRQPDHLQLLAARLLQRGDFRHDADEMTATVWPYLRPPIHPSTFSTTNILQKVSLHTIDSLCIILSHNGRLKAED